MHCCDIWKNYKQKDYACQQKDYAKIKNMKNIIAKQAIDAAGGQAAVARLLSTPSHKLTASHVQNWINRKIPAHWVIAVERVSGVSRHELRPDIYPEE
jgi:DNA-binding transcriptional regulator YdaS (Cro superfamily)